MSIKALYEVALKAKEKYSLSKCIIVHRIGKVFVEEESILIISTSKHRKEAISSVEEIINEVKKFFP
jgi:molybdopterin synthase catalytic subunit